MEHALAIVDDDVLVFEVHRLRGAAGGYGYSEIAAAARAAELALRGGDDDARQYVAKLISAVRGLIA
jgi:hypothetical protein